MVVNTIATAALGLNGGYINAGASAKVSVVFGANITATRDVTLESHATELASNPAMVLGGVISPFGASVIVGMIDATTETTIASGATVLAGGNLALKAYNDATMSASALVATVGIVDMTVAYSKVRVNTKADVAAGAVVGGNNVSVVAWNDNSVSTTATVLAIGAGSVGASVAYADFASHATANFSADLGTANSKISGNLSVEAFSNTTKLATSTSVAVGTNAFQAAVIANGPEALATMILAPLFGDELGIKVAGALSLTSSNQTASASIGGGTGTAPAIYSAGNVSVISRVLELGDP